MNLFTNDETFFFQFKFLFVDEKKILSNED